MTLRQAQAYWLTVTSCLVEFYGVDPDEASLKVNGVLSRLKEDEDFHPTNDLVYHAEPIHIAADLMGREVERTEAFYKTYRQLEQRNLKLATKVSIRRQQASLLQIPLPSEAA